MEKVFLLSVTSPFRVNAEISVFTAGFSLGTETTDVLVERAL